MGPLSGISSREQEVVKLLLEGKSNKQIAASLHIAERTVEFHLHNIYNKLQVRSRMELVLKLRSSTVAAEQEDAENRDRPQARNWVTSLRETLSLISIELKGINIMTEAARPDGSMMPFHEAIRVCLTKYAEFSGRATRAEFWWFALFVVLVTGALTYLSESLGGVGLIALLLPFLAAGTRRLRDSGQSGWWELFLLVPVAGIILLGFMWAMPPARPLSEEQRVA